MNKRVLIVDDDAAVREAICNVLQSSGYEVFLAGDGAEALTRFACERIDMVLLDLNLPSQSGWDVFERITAGHPEVPIIIITGMPDQFTTALAAGVGALMEKPIEAPTLLKTMDQLLAEPAPVRLRRLCGYEQKTKYLRPPSADLARRWHVPANKLRQRRRAHAAPAASAGSTDK